MEEDGIDWKASYHEAHAEANAWKEMLDERTAEAWRLRKALELEELVLMGADLCSGGPPSPEERLAIIRAALSEPPVEDKESPHRVNGGEGAGI
jgi:hypothetical protein